MELRSSRGLRLFFSLPFTPKSLVLACALVTGTAQSATYTVSNEAELRAAISAANALTGPHFIQLSADISVTSALPPVLTDLTIKGNNHIVDGGGNSRLFVVGGSSGTDAPRILVKLSDMELRGGTAQGGNGADGGGGGLGAGGALLVNSQADVLLSNVSFDQNAALGGAGANGQGGGGGGLSGAAGQGIGAGGGGLSGAGGDANGGAGGGGGVGSAGGAGNGGAGGGGGFGGSGGAGLATAGDAGTGLAWASGTGGNGASGGLGGDLGGGGGGSADAGGGGGFAGENATVAAAGDGGFGGGGGGVVGSGAAGAGGFGGGGGGATGTGVAGAGGFGGGGGGADSGAAGAGGFGGGGGSSVTGAGGNGGFGAGGGSGAVAGAGGLGGGNASATQGGGGAGLGGAVFVAQGGSISVDGDISINGGLVSGGAGANAGVAAGSGLFLQGSGTLTLKAGNGKTVEIYDGIADSVGAGVATSNFQRWNLNVTGGGPVPVDTADPSKGSTYGRVVLGGAQLFSGNVFVTGADLRVASQQGLGVGTAAISLDDGGLIADSNLTLTRDITVSTGGGRIGGERDITMRNVLSGDGVLNKVGSGTLILEGSSQLVRGAWQLSGGTVELDADSRLGGSNIRLILDGGTLRYGAGFNDLRGLSLTSNGGTIDNNGFSVALNQSISDWSLGRTLTFRGAGTTELNALNVGEGDTVVAEGTLVGRIATGKLSVAANSEYRLSSTQVLSQLVGQGDVDLQTNTLQLRLQGSGLSGDGFSGTISGSGGLLVTRPGLPSDFDPIADIDQYGFQLLSGNNTYSGGTRVETGAALLVTSDASLGSGAVVLAGGVLANSSGVMNRDITLVGGGGLFGNIVMNGVVSGAGSLVKYGAGTLRLTAANTYTGNTIVAGDDSYLEIANANAIGAGRLQLTLGGGLRVLTDTTSLRPIEILDGVGVVDVGNFDVQSVGGITGAAADSQLRKEGSGRLLLTGDLNLAAGVDIAEGILQLGNGGASGTVSGNVQIAQNARFVINRSGNVTVGGDLSGGGGVTINGPGTVLLQPANANTFLGGLTVNNGYVAASTERVLGFGDFTLDGGGLLLLGDINRDVTIGANGADFRVDGANVFAFDGDMNGTGNFTKSGTGTLLYTGVAGRAGALTTVAAGTLQIGSGNKGALLGDVNVQSGADLVFGRDDLTLYSGVINGSGTVTKLGAGELVLTGEQLFSGVFDVQAGNLRVGFGGNSGSLSGDVQLANNTALVFDRADSTAYAGAVNGSGRVEKNGAGDLTVTGNWQQTGGTSVNGGRLIIGDYRSTVVGSGLSGQVNGDINLAGNSQLVMNRADAVTVSGAITGSGALRQSGSGITTLSGNNTFSGGVIVENGRLAIDSDARLGTGALVLREGGLLRFLANFNLRDVVLQPSGGGIDTNGFNIDYSGLVSGSGNFIKEGAGRLQISRLLLEGNLAINEGELRLGNAADSIDSVGSIGNATVRRFTDGLGVERIAELSFNRNGLVSVEGILSGGGNIRQLGGGELRLLENSSAFTGTVYVDNGRLRLNGVVGGDVELATNTIMYGTGTATGTVRVNDAVLSPGNSIGTINVGALTLSAASFLDIEVDQNGNNDKVNVTGAASLAGTLRVQPQAGDYKTAGCCTYTIIQAGSVTGTFSAVTNSLAFLDATVSYGSNSVTLNLRRNAESFAGAALSFNQQQVARALDAIEAIDSVNSLVQQITPLSQEAAAVAFRDLAGDSSLNMANATISNTRRFSDVLSARASRLGLISRGGNDAGIPIGQQFNQLQNGQALSAPVMNAVDGRGPTAKVEGVWIDVVNVATNENADATVGSAASRYQGKLLSLGVDGYWTPNWIVGFAAGQLQGTQSFSNRVASAENTGVYGGTYLRFDTGQGWNYQAALVLSQQQNDQTRTGTIGSSSFTATSTANSTAISASFQAGLPLHLGNYSLRPHALLDMQLLQRDAYTETGAGAASLDVDAAKDMTGQFGIGVEFSRPFLTAGERWAQWQGSVQLLQPFGDTARVQTARFVGTTPSFTVQSTVDDGVALGLSFGGQAYLTQGLAVWGGYEGRVSASTQESNLVLSAQYRW